MIKYLSCRIISKDGGGFCAGLHHQLPELSHLQDRQQQRQATAARTAAAATGRKAAGDGGQTVVRYSQGMP